MASRAAALSFFMASLLFGAGAQAQTFVRTDCQGVVAPGRYDTAVHERWYKRFWTGSCDAEIPRCIPGSPNWNGMVGKLLARSTPAERPAVLAKACRVGQLIGVEWSRSKLIRKIDLGDLRAFNHTLESEHDVLAGLDKVERAARTELASR